MARGDPVEQAILRLEARRFASRCDLQDGLIQRADTLRELSRLAAISLPHPLANDYGSRDAQRRVTLAAEERAREIIHEQIERYARAAPDQRGRLKAMMSDDWSHLAGVLAHLRAWAHGKLVAAEQSR